MNSLRRIRIPWETLSAGLEIRFLAPPEDAIREAAYAAAGDLDEQEAACLDDSLVRHWALGNVLVHHLSIEDLIDPLNSWAHATGLTMDPIPDWDVREDALIVFVSSAMIEAHRAFLGEAIRAHEMTTETVVAVLAQTRCQEPPIEIDLSAWDLERED